MAAIIILMMHPVLMLSIGIVVIALLFWTFLPKKGLFALFTKMKMNNQKVQLEDALKYLFDCEYNKKLCSVNSIAGNLNTSTDKATQLVERLIEMGLIVLNGESISLTETGRSYSLRVIRVHRIWERYLADETSVDQRDWHDEADRMEHFASEEETEKIAAHLGNPVFDPDGDPIPSVDGTLPIKKGISINSLNVGDTALITHIEDEPKSIYEQLTVQGFYPGMKIYVTNIDDGKITLALDGDECTLTPLFASQITVEPTKEELAEQPNYDLLSSLKPGDQAEIAGISKKCWGQQRRRLMDLGIVPGSIVSAEIKSASGDPVGYRIMGATIGIRKTQSDLIFINKIKS